MPENSICHEIDTGKHYYLANGEWHQLPARGGGEGLPDNFPAEDSANANKFLGFDANGDYTAKDAPSGGGAERFVVTLTEENDTWTADKTVAEIVAADAAGKIVVAKYPFNGFLCDVPCLASGVVDEGDAGTSMAAFIRVLSIGSDGTRFANIVGHRDAEAESDFWHVNEVIQDVLPSGENEGDLLVWDSDHDQWKAESNPNAPLIVTMTEGETEGPYVGDKTIGEIKAAFEAGRNVVCTIPVLNKSVSIILVAIEDNDIVISTGNKDIAFIGAANEYPSITP